MILVHADSRRGPWRRVRAAPITIHARLSDPQLVHIHTLLQPHRPIGLQGLLEIHIRARETPLQSSFPSSPARAPVSIWLEEVGGHRTNMMRYLGLRLLLALRVAIDPILAAPVCRSR